MKRATRVPASSVVRMNSASNIMAKWYHSDSSVSPKALANNVAMPTASEGAPPVRANSVVSPISRASAFICSTVTGKPQPEIFATAAAASAPTTPAGLLIAK